jgi:hypothetical protein
MMSGSLLSRILMASEVGVAMLRQLSPSPQ